MLFKNQKTYLNSRTKPNLSMVGVLFSLDSNHGLGFGEVQLPIPKRQSLAKGQVNVKHIFGNFGSKLLPFVNICIGLLHYFSLIYETMLLQLSMFHKIPKIKKEFSIQINPNPNPNSNPRVVPPHLLIHTQPIFIVDPPMS